MPIFLGRLMSPHCTEGLGPARRQLPESPLPDVALTELLFDTQPCKAPPPQARRFHSGSNGSPHLPLYMAGRWR
jgi:hypothetical protein